MKPFDPLAKQPISRTGPILNCRWKPSLTDEQRWMIQGNNANLSKPLDISGYDYLIFNGHAAAWVDAMEYRAKP